MTGMTSSTARGASFGQRNPLAIFFAVSLILGSGATWLIADIPSNALILPLLAFPISYVPAITAVVILHRASSEEGRRAFRERLRRWQVGARWYAVAVLILPLIAVTATALTTLWGGQFPFHPQMFALLPLFLLTNLGEEIGWRGYALPRLQKRFSSLTASLILGAVWAAFHWVALLQNPTQTWAYLAIGSVYLLAMSVVMTWMFNHVSGSIPIMALMHATYDVVSIGVLPLAETSRPLLGFALGASIACAVAVVLILVHGVELGRTMEVSE